MTTSVQTVPRTQSDRRALTRKALLDATIDVLQTTGYDGCSLANVAKHAGLTTGSLQHHFNTKAQLMLAVIEERLFEIDVESLELKTNQNMANRCRYLVERQWQFYGDSKYPAIWSIILGGRADSDVMQKVSNWQQDAIARHERVIGELFADVGLKPAQIRTIQYFVNSQLRGLALVQTIDPNQDNVKSQLNMLVNMLERHVSEAQC